MATTPGPVLVWIVLGGSAGHKGFALGLLVLMRVDETEGKQIAEKVAEDEKPSIWDRRTFRRKHNIANGWDI